ncbi:MAG: UDP-3-O-acyl-N-acetylglucosamine deacetylase [Planctomycetota bacterium]
MALLNIAAKTLKTTAVLTGAGLHTGQTVTVRIGPAAVGTGIVWVRSDLPGHPIMSAQDVDHAAAPFRTALKNGLAEAHTIEHLMAALSTCGITDCRIEINGLEVPGMDGSALPFFEALHRAGIVVLGEKSTQALVLDHPISIIDGPAEITALPRVDGLKIHYTLHYPEHSLAQGAFELNVTEETFLKEIASARTFVLKKDTDAMRAAGLGKGADFQNTLVIDGDHALETALRYDNEPVRHKILDLIGDLYTLGRPVYADIIAKCTGHRHNRQLVARMREELQL